MSEGKKPFILVLAGGSGTRFWPASTRETPKQVLPGLGPDGETLLEATLKRLKSLTRPERIYVMTAQDQLAAVRPHCLDLPDDQLLFEPEPKNTGPAVALGVLQLARKGAGPHDPVLVIPADAWVDDDEAFRATLRAACRAAEAHKAIVTVGIEATRPETGYGWIETGEPVEVEGADGVVGVQSFREKPDSEGAEALLAAGARWNAGIFAFRLGYLWWLLGDLDEQWDLAMTMMSACLVDGDAAGLANEYANFESISLDHAVIERAPHLLCVPGSFGWSDLGSWDAVGAVLPEVSGGRGAAASVQAVDASGNVVFAPGQEVALLGVDDLVVVSVDGRILVAPRDRAQEVRALAEGEGA